MIDLHPIEDQKLLLLLRTELRIPRALVASLLSIGIASAGCITQTIFQNPLASPSILGASSGAVLFTLIAGSVFSPIFQPLSSFIGAFSVLIMFLIFWRLFTQSSLESLLIFGFATNTLISSINQLIISFNLLDFEKTTSSLQFLMGDLSSKGWHHVYIGTAVIIPPFILSIIRAPKYDILALGKDLASNIGINVNRTYSEALLLAGFMIGGAISIGGIFPFLGLVLPFIMRTLVGPNLRILIPTTAFIASIVTLCVDYFLKILFIQKLYILALSWLY